MADTSLQNRERSVGKKYASMLRSAIRSKIRSETVSQTGLLLKTQVSSRMKDGRLDRLQVTAPHYGFKLHYGFEGIRKNGRKLSLKPTDHLQTLREVTILNGLADEIGDIRAEQVIAEIKF